MKGNLPQPAASDRAAWKRLVKEARLSAADPALSCGDLAKAERAAKRALVIGPLSKENPCVVLQRLAARYAALTARARREITEELRSAAAEVDDCLKPLAGEQPLRRHRADIDG